jgi:hypothetical protein
MSDLRSLIEAAKADAPTAATRAKVWAGVSSAVGGAAAATGGTAGGVVAGSAGAAKMLFVGGLFGGTLAIGVGAVMLFLGHSHPVAPAAATLAAGGPAEGAFVAIAANEVAPAAVPVAVDEAEVNAPAVAIAARPLGARVASAGVVPVASAEAGRKAPAAHGGFTGPASPDDTLAREASQLAEARKALVRRDALSALQIVRGLSALPSRQLVPEELAVEAQALRGLGLDDDATSLETSLHERFPDSVLGR